MMCPFTDELIDKIHVMELYSTLNGNSDTCYMIGKLREHYTN